jgi:DNA-binding winged helix-turn-helix (wHTH) protein
MANSGKGEDSRTSVSAGEVDGRPLAVPEMAFSFGPFRLLPRQHLLLQDGNPIQLRSRAFEILVALVERAGELLDRSSLEARAWPGITVEESNLRAQITALRRVLAQGGTGVNYVVAAKGRGYRTAALHGEITLKDGRVQQANFDAYQMLRIDEAPRHRGPYHPKF